jgi:adenylosuccinate synthase
MINYADVIVDLQAGDTGKGKVAHALLENSSYTHVIRYNGGGNAGHTIYHNGKKLVTHCIPCGVMYGIKSIIGPGCVVHPGKLFEEIKKLERAGIDVKSNLYIDKRVHVITDNHLEDDGKDSKIGTTKQGIGPVYRDKYGRVGLRAENCNELSEFIFDIYDLHIFGENKILFEGAQGFELDIDWGDYPYVTSSHCTVGSAVLNGVPPQKIKTIYGIAKAYCTYVGAKKFEPSSSSFSVFDKIREIGNEYGSTTGRERQINWINLHSLVKAININGVTDLIINKLDVMEKVGVFKIKMGDEDILKFNDSLEFKNFIDIFIRNSCPTIEKIIFSVTPFGI